MKYHIITLGCPKNVVDSEGMQGILERSGHTAVPQMEDADVIIVNTCSFIKAARDEALAVLREVTQQKRPHQHVIAAGCMAQSHASMLQTLPGVEATLSTRQWMHIGTLLASLNGHDSPSCDAPLKAFRSPSSPAGAHCPVDYLSHALATGKAQMDNDWRTAPVLPRQHAQASAYIKIADGCNLHCSFCTIPAMKGEMHSKPIEQIVQEARQLVEGGTREIILVAQHLTDYGRDTGMQDGLVRLLDALCLALPEDIWIRLMYAYPQGITPRLIAAMAQYPQICAYLDMPLQHAHPATLRRMHRPPDIEETRETIAMLREAMPDIALRSTCIVGFPGETEEEFAALLAFLQEVRFEWVGAFRYSRESATPSAHLPAQVKPRIIERRWHKLMQLQQTISLARNQQWHGRELEVLVEGEGVLDDGRVVLAGRSFREAPGIDGQILVWGSAEVGTIVRVALTQATAYDLWGELVKNRKPEPGAVRVA
jgi:ribosomal protein S12 methylthiotransferase